MENTFRNILQMKQKELKVFLSKYLKTLGYTPKTDKKFLYAEGNIPVCLVAHLDTVHKDLPSKIFEDKEKGVIWSPQGIGGDDRCGVYAILKILQQGFRPHLLFTEDEEVGGVGARAAARAIAPEVNFLIEIDRRGNNQAVFYDCGNQEFQDFILGFGFKLEHGLYSDISTLSPAWDVASVNLSAGYYNEHSNDEYIVLDDLQNTIDKVCMILKCDTSKYYDYQEKVWYSTKYYPKTYSGGSYYNHFDFDSYEEEMAHWKKKYPEFFKDDGTFDENGTEGV